MNSTPVTPCINDALPEEVLGVIFEEHAKLEWRAPMIDGLVCKQWRRTILRSPRAWAHLEIGVNFESAPSKLCRWLESSGEAPLHIQVNSLRGLEEILFQHYKRFESLKVRHSIADALLKNRSFPILQSFTISDWDIFKYDLMFHWRIQDAMPALRSLRVGHVSVDGLSANTLPPLRVLILRNVVGFDCIIKNSSHSLTTLMLDHVEVLDTLETLEFPSLSLLSLYEVMNLKHRLNLPALTTYHEGARTEEESFPMSLPFLTEYGIYQANKKPLFSVTRLHLCYPNLSRLSIRAHPPSVKAILHSLSNRPTSLPMLRILAVGPLYGADEYSREDKDSMMNDVFVRNTGTSVKMELCFDGKLRVPLYFGEVRVCIKEGSK